MKGGKGRPKDAREEGAMGTRGVKACVRSLEAVGGRVAACIDDSDKGRPAPRTGCVIPTCVRACVRARTRGILCRVFSVFLLPPLSMSLP